MLHESKRVLFKKHILRRRRDFFNRLELEGARIDAGQDHDAHSLRFNDAEASNELGERHSTYGYPIYRKPQRYATVPRPAAERSILSYTRLMAQRLLEVTRCVIWPSWLCRSLGMPQGIEILELGFTI